MFTFIHAADLHLDSALQGLEQYENAPLDRIRGATRRALANLVDLTLAERAKFLLIAGDVYDGDWKDYNTGLFFNREMGRLHDAGVPVLLISGNHDAESEVTRALRPPPNVVRLSVTQPETHRIESLGVAVHGQGFATRAITHNLAVGYPPADAGLVNVGLLHSSVTVRDDHERYAPCDLTDLRGRGYDYWALGHIHKRQHLATGGGGGGQPWVVFPGNLQGRHVRETGGKGASVVTVDNGRVTAVAHRDLDVVRWASLTVDATAAEDDEAVLGRLERTIREARASAGDRLLAARVRFTGPCRAHADISSNAERWQAAVRDVATRAADGSAWVERVTVNTTSDTVEGAMVDPDGPAADVRAVLDELRAGNPDAVAALAADLAGFVRALPPNLRSGPDAVCADGEAGLADLLVRLASEELPGMLGTHLVGAGE